MATETRDNAVRLEDVFARAEGADTRGWLWRPLLDLLLHGQPVTVDEIAAATGHPAAEPSVERDQVERDQQDRVVGHGITLRPTPHRFTIDGRQLYTWCALDTLVFPGILGRTAQVESPCHTTGTPVRLTVDPTVITHLDPATAVVSIVTPDDASHLRASFCNQVHFFATPAAARTWLQAHPAAAILPVHEAYELGSTLGQMFPQDTPPAACC
jgi:alkylmercury lyase